MFALKKVKNYFRSFLLAPFVLLVFDKMAVGLDIFIPINFMTILIVGFLGFLGLIMLIVIYFLIL